MRIYHRLKTIGLWTTIFIIVISLSSHQVSGEVKPITEAQEKLEGITEEEQETLEQLFTLTQEIEEMEREELRLTGEIEELHSQIDELESSLHREQSEYNKELNLLEQVLISYQRGGPASYLEILLQSEDLSTFLGNISLIKDISRNVSELLDSIEGRKEILIEEKQRLDDKQLLLEQKVLAHRQSLEAKHQIKQKQEDYLSQLMEQKVLYEEHLNSLELMWKDLKNIFSSIVEEFSRIIGEGHFTMEDMNLSFSFLSVKGSVSDETFNRVLKENSTLPEIVFRFNSDQIILEVPEKKLVLVGNFNVLGKSALLYEVESGSFYGMPLEEESIAELFKEGPFIIDFEAVAGDLVTIDIILSDVIAKDGVLEFTIKVGFPF